MHHVEVAVLRPARRRCASSTTVFMLAGTTGSRKRRGPLHTGVAFRAAFHAALARQQQDVVVVEDFHTGSKPFERSPPKDFWAAWALGLRPCRAGTGVAACTEPWRARRQNRATRNLGPVTDSTRPAFGCSMAYRSCGSQTGRWRWCTQPTGRERGRGRRPQAGAWGALRDPFWAPGGFGRRCPQSSAPGRRFHMAWPGDPSVPGGHGLHQQQVVAQALHGGSADSSDRVAPT